MQSGDTVTMPTTVLNMTEFIKNENKCANIKLAAVSPFVSHYIVEETAHRATEELLMSTNVYTTAYVLICAIRTQQRLMYKNECL